MRQRPSEAYGLSERQDFHHLCNSKVMVVFTKARFFSFPVC